MKIYETPNPFFLSDIFVFAEVEKIGLCYIKVNCFNRIEEIGFDIQRRMCRPIEDIMQYAKKAAKIRRHIFNSIDIEYWGKIRNQWLRSVKTQTYIENNSGTIIRKIRLASSSGEKIRTKRKSTTET
jgi:hypothetical protein